MPHELLPEAKAILADWRNAMPKFRKVMPVEYRKALIAMSKAQAADKDGLETIEIGLKVKA